jgi:gamma-glutamyl-gamma-aminobutyrate hydrolase PuuD
MFVSKSRPAACRMPRLPGNERRIRRQHSSRSSRNGSFSDHRENYQLPRGQQYQHAHPVEFTRGGLLHEIHGETTAMVNSLHDQVVDRLGDGLQVEAVAPDGLIEAIRVLDCLGQAPEFYTWRSMAP